MPPPVAPASWRLHPRRADFPRIVGEAGEGRAFVVDYSNRLWLLDAGRRTQTPVLGQCSPRSVLPGKEWVFVSESGATCLSTAPLSAVSKAFATPEPLVATAGKSLVVGVRRCGSLVASDNAGLGWQAVDPTRDTAFFDVAAKQDGSLLALGAPEQLWTSADGRHWSRIDAPSVGAYAVEARHGEIYLRGALQSYRLSPQNRLEAARIPDFVPVTGFATTLRNAPSGNSLRAQRAAISGAQYFEVEREPDSHAWRLLWGSLDGPLQSRPLSELACAALKVAAFGSQVYLACAQDGMQDTDVTFYRSNDAGSTFEQEPFKARARMAELTMAAGANEAFVVSGACEDEKCLPDGIFHRGRTGQRLKSSERIVPSWMKQPGSVRPPVPRPVKPVAKAPASPAPAIDLFRSSAPMAAGAALSLVSSADGSTLFALAMTADEQGYLVLKSIDGGRTFDAAKVPDLAPRENFRRPRKIEIDGPQARQGVTAAGLDEVGNVSFVIANESIVTRFSDGKITKGVTPHAGSRLGAAGGKILAVAVSPVRAWESLDAGATWSRAVAPTLSCISMDRSCVWDVACLPSRCFIGDDLTRSIWREPLTTVEPPALVQPPPAKRASVNCVLSEAPGSIPLPGVGELPTQDALFHGKTVLAGLNRDYESRSVTVLEIARDGSFNQRPLFPPLADSKGILASAIIRNGLAAGHRYSARTDAAGQRIGEAVVAWIDLATGKRMESRAGGPEFVPAGHSINWDEPSVFAPNPSGVYIRFPKYPKPSDPLFFFGLEGKVRTLPAPSAGMTPLRVGAADVLFAHKGGLIRGKVAGSIWQFEAYTIAPPHSRAHFGFRDGRPFVDVRSENRSDGWLYELSGKGPLVGAPIASAALGDVSVELSSCTDAELATTPRLVEMRSTQLRRSLKLEGARPGLESYEMQAAVLYGTAEKPCVSGWIARSPRHEEMILWIPGGNGWLITPDRPRSQHVAQPLRCNRVQP